MSTLKNILLPRWCPCHMHPCAGGSTIFHSGRPRLFEVTLWITIWSKLGPSPARPLCRPPVVQLCSMNPPWCEPQWLSDLKLPFWTCECRLQSVASPPWGCGVVLYNESAVPLDFVLPHICSHIPAESTCEAIPGPVRRVTGSLGDRVAVQLSCAACSCMSTTCCRTDCLSRRQFRPGNGKAGLGAKHPRNPCIRAASVNSKRTTTLAIAWWIGIARLRCWAPLRLPRKVSNGVWNAMPAMILDGMPRQPHGLNLQYS